MSTADDVVTIVPYFQIPKGAMEEVRAHLSRMVENARTEPGCLYYSFTIDGHRVHCREGYENAAAVLHHLENQGPLIEELLESKGAELVDLQVHGPAAELDRLREPMAELSPSFWAIDCGFRR